MHLLSFHIAPSIGFVHLRFSLKILLTFICNPGPNNDFMCVKCAQKILKRLTRVELRRLTKMAIVLKAAGELKPIVDKDNKKEQELCITMKHA